MSQNKTSEVEQRLRAIFVLLLAAIAKAAKAAGLPRLIPEDGIVYHVGNTPALLKSATSPNVKSGDGFLALWPDSKRVQTKRTATTVWAAPGLQDYTLATQVVAQSMLLDLAHRNAGTDKLSELLRDVSAAIGMTKGGKVSKGLSQTVAEYVQSTKLGKWPLPGISRVPVQVEVQGRRHAVKAYCVGLLNVDDKGEPSPCMVENTRAKPSRFYRAYHPATAVEEIPDATCYLCGGPMATHADIVESRKNRTETKLVEVA